MWNWQHLATPLPSLIGRELVMEEIRTCLQCAQVRLLTLTGPGGVGKTSLALQVATDLQDRFTCGACFVSLAPISDPDLVITTITQALELTEAGKQPLLDLLKRALQDKDLLLLLDNFEQVVEAAPQLSALLACCPRLKILVTSRAVLNIRDEKVFVVPPLELPDMTSLPESGALSQYGAVALFLQHATAVQPDFEITAGNAHAIAAICVRLGGLPLALELAAPYIKLFSAEELLDRLMSQKDWPQLLVNGRRDRPERHQTLWHTISWSYNLLDKAEQWLFQHLSVFINGCTFEAVEGLCRALGETTLNIYSTVRALIDKNLLQRVEQDRSHLHFLEMVREYALAALDESGEVEVTRRAYAFYYLSLVEEAESKLHEQMQTTWLDRLKREHDNVRSALLWLLEHEEFRQSTEMALRLSRAIWWFWAVYGYTGERKYFARRALHFLKQALEGKKAIAVAIRVKVLNAAASLMILQSNYDQALALLKESLVHCREIGDRAEITRALYLLGDIAWRKGDLMTARSWGEEALQLQREGDDTWGIANSLELLASIALDQGEYARVCCLIEQSQEAWRELRHTEGMAHGRLLLAAVAVNQGEYAKALALSEEGLILSQNAGEKRHIAFALLIKGFIAFFQEENTLANSFFKEAHALSREIGNQWGASLGLCGLGGVALRQGDDARAHVLYEESIMLLKGENHPSVIALCLEGLGGAAMTQSLSRWAAQLWGAAERLRETRMLPMPSVIRHKMHEPVVAMARDQLGEEAFARAWSQGRAMTLEQVLAAQGQEAEPALSLQEPFSSPDGLTKRQVEVLCLASEGLTDKQIAERLVLSPHTVHVHLRSIYNKTGCTSRSGLTSYAWKHNLMDAH
jgi:predicted ATPase/DNA-binding CsgD family transcriptional regulator